MKKVGVLGLGIMGLGIANNLIACGFDVYVYNRSKSKYQGLFGNYNICETPKELAQNVDVLFEVTSDDNSSRSVWLGKDSINSTNKELVGCICSTVSHSWIKELEKSLSDKISLVDSPLTGSRTGAENGTLTLLLGGDQKIISDLAEIFKAISSKQIYFGEVGNGTKFKLILNQIQAIHFAAMANSISQASEVGLDPKQVGSALMELGPSSPAGSLVIKELDGGYDEVQFGLGMLTKDLLYARETLPDNDLTELIYNMFESTNKKFSKEYSDINCTEIYKYFLDVNHE